MPKQKIVQQRRLPSGFRPERPSERGKKPRPRTAAERAAPIHVLRDKHPEVRKLLRNTPDGKVLARINELVDLREVVNVAIDVLRERRRDVTDEQLPRRVAATLKAHLNERGLTQREFDREAGLSEGLTSRILSGDRVELTIQTLHRLAMALRIPLDALVYGPVYGPEAIPPAAPSSGR